MPLGAEFVKKDFGTGDNFRKSDELPADEKTNRGFAVEAGVV